MQYYNLERASLFRSGEDAERIAEFGRLMVLEEFEDRCEFWVCGGRKEGEIKKHIFRNFKWLIFLNY